MLEYDTARYPKFLTHIESGLEDDIEYANKLFGA
jgi:hypothetical protein